MKKLFFFGVFLFCVVSTSFGQEIGVPPPTGGESGEGGAGFDDETNDEIIPINGLIALGLIVGAVYGIRNNKG